MVQNIDQLKKWFVTGAEPTQAQFWDWMDSYIHKNDGIRFADVQGLADYINQRNQSLLDDINKLIVDVQEKLKIEKQYNLTTERTINRLLIASDTTFYRITTNNVDEVTISFDDKAYDIDTSTGSAPCDIFVPAGTLVEMEFVRTLTDPEMYVVLDAKSEII